MSKLKVGDRARITKSYGGFGGEGLEVGDIVTITEVDRHLRYAHSGFHYAAQAETTLGSDVYDLFVEHELAPLLESPTLDAVNWHLREETSASFVHVIESRQIWVTLPGDTAGHKLTETQARTLFHELEAIV